MAVILEVRELSVRYGGVRALDGVDFEIHEGELVGLIGPNGSGKTTCIDALTGFAPATGDVLVAGRSLRGVAPHRRAHLGLCRTWQTGDIFEDLTVRENLSVAAGRSSLWGLARNFARARTAVPDVVGETVSALGLDQVVDAQPSQLTEGQRKLVGVARALVCRPKVLLLDEPAAGLDATQSATLEQQLRNLVDGGLTTVLIDHDMRLVLSICDRIIVLDFGKVIASGTPEEIRSDPRVVAAYLGAPSAAAAGGGGG
jgi:branched-chain amino acid transport system ATP-binding protein